MIYAKPNNYGVDLSISEIQTALNDNLNWAGLYDIYGKCEQTERQGKKQLEFFKGEKEYINPFFDDRKSAVIGFEVEKYNHNKVFTATVNLICTVNLESIYGGDERNDQKAILDVRKILKTFKLCNELTGVSTGVENVFKSYDKNQIKYRGMHPWFVFSITMELNVYEQC